MYSAPSAEQCSRDLDTAARTAWAEARSLGPLGMQAVLNVILNRAAQPGWWSREKGDGILDDTVEAVCRDHAQFSCWLPGDVNLAKLLAVGEEDESFLSARLLAEHALRGELDDITKGATLYHTIKAPPWVQHEWPPSWTHNPKHPVEECYRDKGHVFYRDAK